MTEEWGTRGGPEPVSGGGPVVAEGANEEARPDDRRGWVRAVGLVIAAVALPAVEPSVLVGVPYLLLVLAFPSRRLPALLLGGLVAVLVFGGATRNGVWYIDRGWAVLLAGWFVAITLRWPTVRFSTRALGALGGAGAVVTLIMMVRPGSWSVLDWLVSDRLREGVSTALEMVRLIQGDDQGVSQAVLALVYQSAEWQALVFPAFTGLASFAGLGVGWWLYVRLAQGSSGGLGPVREFRFNDQLVWFFIGGLLLIALGLEGGWTRVGANAVVFMGALYALRGMGVFLFFNGGLSILGLVAFVLGLIVAAPVVVGAALVIGLGDTWLDMRGRARQLVG